MKKILISLLSCLLLTSVAWANYFDNYPKRFVSYDSTSRFKAYIDMDSVNVVRYDPPYYEIQATTYYFDYVLHGGMKRSMLFYYDYDKQTIAYQLQSLYECDEEGNVGRGGPSSITTIIPFKKYSPGYMAGELAFVKAYGIPFTKELVYRLLEERS